MRTQVVLYVAQDCGLCEEARDAMKGAGIAFIERSDDRYLLRVPVIEVAGRVVTEGQISLLAVRRALRRASRAL